MLKKIKAYLDLAKIQITRTVVITSAIGYFIANKEENISKLRSNIFGFNLEKNFILDFKIPALEVFSWQHFFLSLLGISLVCASSCSFNHVLETDSDAKMGRTKKRPILIGTVSKNEAIIFGIVLGTLGLALLTSTVSFFMAICAMLTLALYDLVYTPLKKKTAWNTTVGALPGALPIVGGYVAADGNGWLTPLILFTILFVWQHPHFYAIAWIYRKDYMEAGYKMISANDENGKRTFITSLITALLLIPACLVLTLAIPKLGLLYNVLMFLTCSALVYTVLQALRKPNTRNSRTVVVYSVIFFPIWFMALAIDFWI